MWSLVVHGGSGVIDRADLSPEQDAAYRASLTRTAEVGAAVLKGGGSAPDAVEAAVRVL
ncbi:MAG TPA: isoaspartyl peptidase/L-asparaginase, partial [Phenylobacterium sp.]